MWLYLGLLTAALAAGWLAWVLLKPLLLDGEGASSALPWWWRVAWPWGEILLSAIFFLSAIFYVRPAKRAARRQRA